MVDKKTDWKIPEEYLYPDVSERICAILTGKYGWRR